MEPVSRIRVSQITTDFSTLGAGINGIIVPHDVDFQIHAGPVSGRVHRGIGDIDHFMSIEVKRPGDTLDPAHERSLRAEAGRANSVMILAYSHRVLTSENCYLFSPYVYAVLMPRGSGLEDVYRATTTEDFNRRLDKWCRQPDLGTLPFVEGFVKVTKEETL